MISLSQVQQASWFLYQLDPYSLADKFSFALEINGNIDEQNLETIWRTLINRHSSLRCQHSQNQTLTQKIVQDVNFRLSKIEAIQGDLEEINSLILANCKIPLSVEDGELIRVTLVKLADNEYVLLIVVHTLACDYHSLLNLVDEFISLYQGENLPPLSGDYSSFVQAEQEFLKSPKSQESYKYWQKVLGEDLSILELPTKLSTPTQRSYEGGVYNLQLDNEIISRLRQLASDLDVNLEILLLAAYKVLLYRYSNFNNKVKDILVGVRIASPQRAAVVGNYSEILVVKDTLSSEVSFRDLVAQVQQNITEINNFPYPYPLLVQQLKISPQLVHSPLCQAAFVYRQLEGNIGKLFVKLTKTEAASLSPLNLNYFELPEERVEFDLTLKATEADDTFLLQLKYNIELLDIGMIAQMGRHLVNLLEAISYDSRLSIGKLPLLSDSEIKQILENFNRTKKDYELSQSLPELITSQAEITPQNVALIFEDISLTYAQLNQRANQIANYLQKLAIKRDTLVGICVERSPLMVIGLLGILKAGAAYVPIDPDYPEDRIAYMLADSGVNILLTLEKFQAKLQDYSGELLFLDRDKETISKESSDNPVVEINPDNLAYVLYTSGSTGKPKGAMNTHKGVCNRLLWMQDTFCLAWGDRVLQKTPFSFDVSVWEFFWPLLCGATIVLAKPGGHQDSSYLVNLINAIGITTVHFVPSMLQVFLEDPDVETCTSLQMVMCSGEALSFDLQQRFFSRLGCQLHNLYGPTETAIDVTHWQCQPDSDLNIVPIGKPVDNTKVYVLDAQLQPVPFGVLGELHIGGVQVGRGYLNQPELTAAKFIPNPFNPGETLYKTGDLVRYLPDGNIEYLQRLDHQVKIRGLRIELGEIEQVLTQHPQVRESLVIVSSDPYRGQQLVAYVVCSQESPSIPQLRQYLQTKLPNYMIPAAIVILEAFPLTPNGKLDRQALPNYDVSKGESSQPQDVIESQLLELWSELLGIKQIGLTDNFFDLGGHSLLAIKLIGKIQQRFSQKLPLATLLSHATIADLAKVLRQQQTKTYSPLVSLQPKGTKQPLYCIHPAGGHVLCYMGLSRYLGDNQPFYGLQAQGFNAGETPLSQVEDMASLYVKAIREFQPQGPYQVGGWSFGGVVAYEVAQQLQQQGQEVNLLAILDSYVPILLDPDKKIDDVYLVGVLSRVFGGMFGLDNLVSPNDLVNLSVDEQIEFIIDKAKQAGIFPPEVEQQDNRRILDVLVGTLKATYTYQRQPYPGKVTVFRAQEKHIMASDPQLVWVELFSILDSSEIEIVKVPGSHYTFVLEPHLPILAQRLQEYLS